MAVESRFVVIRHGAEVKTFMDKKSADEYDRMLDMADNLADVFSDSPIELSDGLAEELSIYLAQKREEVLVALLAKKPAKPVAKKSVVKSDEKEIATTDPIEHSAEDVVAVNKDDTTKSSAVKRKAKSA